jgi:hypothetical protein
MAPKTQDAEKCVSRGENQVAHGACQKLHLPRFQKLSKNKKQWGHETLILKDLLCLY